jgi:hypothetical protein
MSDTAEPSAPPVDILQRVNAGMWVLAPVLPLWAAIIACSLFGHSSFQGRFIGLFPVGLTYPSSYYLFPEAELSEWLLSDIGWAFYGALLTARHFVPQRAAKRMLTLLFVVMLLLNLGGCYWVFTKVLGAI